MGDYIYMHISGKLNACLANIDRQAQERFEKLIESMEQAQDIKRTPKGRKRFRVDRKSK